MYTSGKLRQYFGFSKDTLLGNRLLILLIGIHINLLKSIEPNAFNPASSLPILV